MTDAAKGASSDRLDAAITDESRIFFLDVGDKVLPIDTTAMAHGLDSRPPHLSSPTSA